MDAIIELPCGCEIKGDDRSSWCLPCAAKGDNLDKVPPSEEYIQGLEIEARTCITKWLSNQNK